MISSACARYRATCTGERSCSATRRTRGRQTWARAHAKAIEDAVVLAASLTQHGDPLTALARYDEQRCPRTQAMTRAAHQTHQLNARHSSLVLAAARVMPPSLWRRQITRWTDWTPPAITRYASDRPGGQSDGGSEKAS
jgi:hypothetical protein